MLRLKLHPKWNDWTGFNRVTYEAPRPNYGVYCLLDDGVSVRLYRCSTDGEPSHEVSFRGPVSFERPPSDTRLGVVINEFLDDADHFSEGLNSAFVEDIRAAADKAMVVFRKELGGAARKDGLMAVDQSASVAAKVRKARSALYAVALEALAAEGTHVKFDSKEVPRDEAD